MSTPERITPCPRGLGSCALGRDRGSSPRRQQWDTGREKERERDELGCEARERALHARGKKRGAAAVREGESRREGTRRRAGRMERKRKRGHCLNVSARSHARRACAEYPGPSWTPRLPPRVIGSLALPLLSLSSGSKPSRSLALSYRGHVPPSPTSLVLSYSLAPAPPLSSSLCHSPSLAPFRHPHRFKCGRLPFFLSATFFLSIRFSSANNIRFHHLSRRGDRTPNVRLLLPLLSPINKLL